MYGTVTQAINQEASTHVHQAISRDERDSGAGVGAAVKCVSVRGIALN